MTQPTSIINSASQSLDVIVDSAGVIRLKLAIGSKGIGGLANVAGWQGVATHIEQGTFVASDGVVLIAGVDPTGTPTVRRFLVDANGQVIVRQVAATGTHVNVAASISSVTLRTANALRKGLTIWNDSTAILYVKLDASAASATSCTVKLVADAYYEVPFGYTGEIRGIWATATGSARVVELS